MNEINKIVSDLCHFSPRQGENEVKTAGYIQSFLISRHIKFSLQYFDTQIPLTTKCELYLDGRQTPCLGCTFIGGIITSKDQVVFSPHSDFIEMIKFQDFPCVSISRSNKDLLKNAKQISGEVVVEKYSFQSRNILVGNCQNPRKIIFAHYDGLGGGAVDNAGSVAVCLTLLAKNLTLLTENLFVFSGNEELSYDQPIYWGRGFREFEKEYFNILNQVSDIFVVDGIGVTPSIIVDENKEDVLPLNNYLELSSKITWISSTQSEILKNYHCAEDTPDKLNSDFLFQSVELLKNRLLTPPEADRI